MGKYNFDYLVDRYNSQSRKYESLDHKVFPMWVADMDFEAFPKVTEALKKRLETPCYGYSLVPDEFFTAYVNYWKRHYSVKFTEDECVFSTGVVASIDCIFRHFVRKGSKVLVQTPVYHTFFHCIENNGLEAIECPLVYTAKEYHLDLDALEKMLKLSDVETMIFCNPHNPTGYLFNLEEVNRIARLCYENNVLLISDEIHSEIRDPGFNYASVLLAGAKYLENAIVLLAGSKCFNLAGLQSSIAVIKNKKMREKFQEAVWQDDIGEPNFFAVDANIAAFNDGDEWIKEMNEYVTRNKKYVKDFLKKEKINVVCGHATYLVWLDISKYTDDSEKFCADLKKKTGLWLSAGKDFRGDGKIFARMNVATSIYKVADGCNRLAVYLHKNYQKK